MLAWELGMVNDRVGLILVVICNGSYFLCVTSWVLNVNKNVAGASGGCINGERSWFADLKIAGKRSTFSLE